MLSIIQGANAIRKVIRAALEDNDGAIIGRNGSTELELMLDVNKPYLYSALTNNAGIFPLSNISDLLKWQTASIDATSSSDILATGWYKPLVDSEQVSLKQWKFQGIQVPLRSLEPYYVEPSEQWTQCLSGHRVAVISSFTKTMQKQLAKKDMVWTPTNQVIPDDVHWSWVQTGYSPDIAKGHNEWPPGIKSWSHAVEYAVSEVIDQGARFALIGCGGLSMPIAKALKDRGVIAIVLGGAIQVLFGIKGRRWENHEIISKFWNDSWTYPSKDEIPQNAHVIEGGCYW
jgi:hypothetical protein